MTDWVLIATAIATSKRELYDVLKDVVVKDGKTWAESGNPGYIMDEKQIRAIPPEYRDTARQFNYLEELSQRITVMSGYLGLIEHGGKGDEYIKPIQKAADRSEELCELTDESHVAALVMAAVREARDQISK